MKTYDGPPAHPKALNTRLRNTVGEGAVGRVRNALAGVIVAQMLPPGAVKGGSAMKLRLGDDRSRFTQDLDVARHDELDRFIDLFETKLREGWAGFTGGLVRKQPPRPVGVPAEYIMRPFEVKLSYKGQSWVTVPVEVGHDELGDTVAPTLAMAEELAHRFVQLGLPAPDPVPVVPTEHQIAQKLHACSEPGSERAHDLVDLQLLTQETVDMQLTAELCRRLFASRHRHSWPPTVTVQPRWDTLYEEAAEGIDGVLELPSAIDWTNDLIRRLDAHD